MRVYELFWRGGLVMWPLLVLSVMTLTYGFDRAWFWLRLLRQEDLIVRQVLDAARADWTKAEAIARQATSLPIGRFLLAPLQLQQPDPETFHLAMEAAADREFIQMRRGNQFFETVVALAPLLGLLGTVTGLIATFSSLDIGNVAGTDTGKAAAGIGEALLTTAFGMIVAIMALILYRIFVSLQTQQTDYFFTVGNELELIYRQIWFAPASGNNSDENED
ncbi:MAG: MotA/TolQ/ExbB proton channel family protein [Geitlerinemataceae cyanobacterium]